MTAKATTSQHLERRTSSRQTAPCSSTSGPSGADRAAWSRPILDQIQAENPDKITVLKLNVDEHPDLAMKYQITSIPAMKVFNKGEVADHDHRRQAEVRARAGPRAATSRRSSSPSQEAAVILGIPQITAVFRCMPIRHPSILESRFGAGCRYRPCSFDVPGDGPNEPRPGRGPHDERNATCAG